MLVREEDSVLEKTFRECEKRSCLCSSAGLGKRKGRSSRKQLSRDHIIISTEPALGPTASKCRGRSGDCAYAVGTPLFSPT